MIVLYGFHVCLVLLFASIEISAKLPVRLVGGKHHYSGRIEIFYKGKWAGVCSHRFRKSEALVACREAGFADVVRVFR